MSTRRNPQKKSKGSSRHQRKKAQRTLENAGARQKQKQKQKSSPLAAQKTLMPSSEYLPQMKPCGPWAEEQCLEGHLGSVYSVSWSPDGTRLASASSDTTVRIWNGNTGKEEQRLEGHSNSVNSVSWSPDGTRLASGSSDQTIRIWDGITGKEEQCLEGHSNKVRSVSWSPDGTRLASGSSDQTIRIWDGITWKEKQCLEGHSRVVYTVSWSPDGTRLATGSHDYTVRIWNVTTGQEEQRLKRSGWVRSVSWSPDGTRLASGSDDKTVRIWNESTGKEEQCLEGHSYGVRSVSWSPDGTRLASGSYDKTVRIWNGSTGKEEQRLEGHSDYVTSVSWSPDGTRLATASNDHTVRIWKRMFIYTDPPLDPPAKMSSAKVKQIQQAAMAWGAGDVYRAWHTIGEVCQAPWVTEVIEALGLSEDGLEETDLDGSGLEETGQEETTSDPAVVLTDRARRIRSAIDKQVAMDAADSDLLDARDHPVESSLPRPRVSPSSLPPAQFVAEEGPDAGSQWSLGQTAVVIVGRKSADERSLCDIPLCDAAVSRQHCLVQFLAGQWTIRDLESTNGVRLNGEPIGERIAIESNDIVTIGTTELLFQLGEGNHSEENKSCLKSDSRILREEQEILEKLLGTSLDELDSFLDEAPDDEAITWLRESAKHTIESQQHSTDQPLRVALLGEFSSGKTRLINALLGEKILSTGIVPVTRSVTRIVHGDEISVTVRHVDGTEMEVGVDQLKAYTDERRKEEGASEVEEVILRHPSPLLKKVELWDTPGFNSDNQLHDQVAAQLLLEADAVLWIQSPHQVGTRSEGKLLETVRRAQGKVVAVLNQTDRLDDDKAITKQVAEVKKHYAKTVEEVVPTSARWLEQDHPGGNRERLLAHIDAIGAWSQEQRQRRTARRVAAVAAQGMAYLALAKEETCKLEEQQLQHDKQLKAQHQTSLDLWKEALEHRDRLHDVRKDEKDQWFDSHCAYRTPLTLAYRALLREELTLEGYTALIPCLHALEETHWHVSPHDPVPWRDDFLLSWRKGMERSEVSQKKPLFHSAERKESPGASWLQQLTGIKKTTFPRRWAGSSEFSARLDKIQDVFSKLTALPEAEELSKWWQELDASELQRKPPSASRWLKRVRAATAAAPARKFHRWVELEDRVSDLAKNYTGPLARTLKQMAHATKRIEKLDQELVRFRKVHAIHRFVTGTLRWMLRISSFVMRKDNKASSTREFLFPRLLQWRNSLEASPQKELIRSGIYGALGFSFVGPWGFLFALLATNPIWLRLIDRAWTAVGKILVGKRSQEEILSMGASLLVGLLATYPLFGSWGLLLGGIYGFFRIYTDFLPIFGEQIDNQFELTVAKENAYKMEQSFLEQLEALEVPS